MGTGVPNNREVSAALREMGDRLQHSGESPFRVAAYWRAAETIAACPREVAAIFAEEGEAGLQRLPGIGRSLARTLKQFLSTGRSSKLERLRRIDAGESLLRTLPGVGRMLAERMRQTLGSDSLEEVFAAAYDGRLQRVPGFGRKRLRSIRESLASRLQVATPLPTPGTLRQPPIADLLSIDDEYREKVTSGRLPRAAPRLYNPTGQRWLPILHTRRNNYPYVAHFANTARSHQLGRIHDWVVITCDSKQAYGQWTVITATRGTLQGRRVVMHREQDCRDYYRQLRTQMALPLDHDSASKN